MALTERPKIGCTRAFGGVEGGRWVGDATRTTPFELLVDNDGDAALPTGGDIALIVACAWEVACACEVLVARCIREGGALAIALAFARLAAIAAATLDFLVAGCDELVGSSAMRAAASGVGHAFSKFFRLGASSDKSMTLARSDHTLSYAQNAPRADSRTPTFASCRALFTS